MPLPVPRKVHAGTREAVCSVMYICRCRIPHIARHGVYITTPEVSSSRATVAVQVEVDGWQKHDVRIRTTLRNPEGVIVGSVQSGMPEHTHQTCTEVKLPALTLENPTTLVM